MGMSRNSKTASFQRIVNDMLRFNEEQLNVMIKLGKKVLRAKRSLRESAQDAEQFVQSMMSRTDTSRAITHEAVNVTTTH